MTDTTTASGAAEAGLHALADRIEEAQGRAICISVESANYLRKALAASAPAPTMVDMVPPATSRDRWMYEQGRLAERDPRTSRAAPVAPTPPGFVLVPLEFVRGFNTLAHNYSLRAEPPDYYRGVEGDAFSRAYARCGQDLAELITKLKPAPEAAPVAPTLPKGWREVLIEARNGLEDSTPSSYDNAGYRAFAGSVLDSIQDELSALETEAAPVAPAPQPAINPRTQYLTVVYQGVEAGDEARVIYEHPKVSAASWSHALDDRDAALAAAPKAAPADQEIGLPFGIIDPDYAKVYTLARVVAWQHGYAIGLQGSFTRGLDLLAVPWTDRACSLETLVQAIEYRSGLKRQGPPSDKSHGRKAVSLLFPGFEDPRWVDLSILPRMAAPAPVAEDEIRKALHDAATSLETIGRIAGRDQYMLGMMDVRLYAAARAKVAREALAAQPEGGAKHG